MTMNWFFLLITVVAFGLMIYVRHGLVYLAKGQRGWRIFMTVCAIFCAILAVLSWIVNMQQAMGVMRNLEKSIGWFFIIIMFFIFGYWPRGLTKTSLVNGLASSRGYRGLSAMQLSKNPDGGTHVEAMVGAAIVAKMNFKKTPEDISRFLKRNMDPKRVVMMK